VKPWELAGMTQAAFRRMPIRSRLAVVSACFLGWRYSLTVPRVPFKVGSLPASLVTEGASVTNCSTLTAAALMACYPEAPWTLEEYGDFQVFADRLPDKPNAPILAIERVGIGSRVAAPVANAVHLVQGWRKAGATAADFRGHAVIVTTDEDATRLRVLEATSRSSNLGARWRSTPLDDFRRDFPAAIYFGALGAG
jgi:hypothetical protein